MKKNCRGLLREREPSYDRTLALWAGLEEYMKRARREFISLPTESLQRCWQTIAREVSTHKGLYHSGERIEERRPQQGRK